MIAYRHVRMDLMTSKQVAEYLRDNDMVVLPVGCFEMHGPHIPLACDTFHAWASSLLLADVWKCLCLPPVHYVFPGASGPWPGTVDISPDVSVKYLTEIVLGLLKGGFKRVVMYGTHGPLSTIFQMVIRTVYQDTRQVVIGMQGQVMPPELMQEKLGYERGEDILVAASMEILGLGEAYDPSASSAERPREVPFPSVGELARHGAKVPWIFSRDYQHTGLRGCIAPGDVAKAVEVMKTAAAGMADLPEHFARTQRDMAEMIANPPWESPDCWTE